MSEPQIKGCFSSAGGLMVSAMERGSPDEQDCSDLRGAHLAAQPSAERAGALLKTPLCGTFLSLKAFHIMLEQEWEMPCLRLPVVRAKNDPISSRTGLAWAQSALGHERGHGLGLLLLPTGTLPPPPARVLFLIQLLRGMERGRGGCCPRWKSKEHCFLIMGIVLPSWIIIILHRISFFFFFF